MEQSDIKRVQLEKLEKLRSQLKLLPAGARGEVVGELNGRTEQLYEFGILTRRESDDEYVQSDIARGRGSPSILVD
nr:hypothetical protein [Pseudomonas sp. Marseille-Q3773]